MGKLIIALITQDSEQTMSLLYEKVADFKHILRVFNTNLDGKRKVPFALRTIRGIGRRFANLACRKAKIDPHRRAGDLNEAEAQKLIDIINDPIGNGSPSGSLTDKEISETVHTLNWLPTLWIPRSERILKE